MTAFPILVDPSSPFPIENVPFGIFSTAKDLRRRAGTAIGSLVLDLAVLEKSGLFSHISDSFGAIFSQPVLNAFAALSRSSREQVRTTVIELLSKDTSILFTDASLNQEAFHALADVQLHIQMEIPEFTDFSCYEEHVGNCFKMAQFPFGADSNFYYSPIAYNGRTSSLVLSGVDIPRPRGMYKDPQGVPAFQPCSKLDYELEMGIFVSKPVSWGKAITPDEVAEHIFGFVLLNDWSARDIQMYESLPAGPLNSKAFATSISPWVIVPESLSEAAAAPLGQDPGRVPTHLRHRDMAGTIYDVDTSVYIARDGKNSVKLSTTNLKHAYFSLGQALAHRASSGCGLRTGELVATGTISSPAASQIDPSVCHQSCLMELSWDGTKEVPIIGGKFLADGDRVTFDAWAMGKNGRRIGFGELTSKILPCTTEKLID